MTGRLVISEEGLSLSKMTLDVSALESGNYSVVITSAENRSTTTRFVK
jgi:hypothetical protein